jgi:hypothetical protein
MRGGSWSDGEGTSVFAFDFSQGSAWVSFRGIHYDKKIKSEINVSFIHS